MPHMSHGVRDVFIIAGLIAAYGMALWLYEAKLASAFGETFSENPHAISAQHDRDQFIAQEMSAPSFTPPADDMLATEVENA